MNSLRRSIWLRDHPTTAVNAEREGVDSRAITSPPTPPPGVVTDGINVMIGTRALHRPGQAGWVASSNEMGMIQ